MIVFIGEHGKLNYRAGEDNLKQKPKYTRPKETPCSGKEHAMHLARLITYYADDRAKENKRHEKAIKKIESHIHALEKRIRDMGDDAFSDEIIMMDAR